MASNIVLLLLLLLVVVVVLLLKEKALGYEAIPMGNRVPNHRGNPDNPMANDDMRYVCLSLSSLSVA